MAPRDASSRPTTPLDRLQPAHTLRALLATLDTRGVPAAAVLDGTGLHPGPLLTEASALVSLTQAHRACDNALRLCDDPSLPAQVASRLRPADLGLVGMLLLSAASVRHYLVLATRYQALTGPVAELEPLPDGGGAIGWRLHETAAPEASPVLRRFLVALQVAVQVEHWQALLGRPCRFDAADHRVCFPAVTLAERPRWADPRAAAALEAACETQLAELDAAWSLTGKVVHTLRRLGDPAAGMKAVASALRMTDRTLRRRLAMEGTSFSTLVLQQKVNLATRQLKATHDSIETVAAVAGYSDSSNFRRAFVRWTRMTPAQFRRHSRG
jgi:AraC-like DNA-binding protein